jgi:AcrR family transcriptional regulator
MAESRDVLLELGVEGMAAGLRVGLDLLNFEAIIRQSGLPRSTVFKLWRTKEHYFTDLAIRMVEPDESSGAAFDEETLRLAREVVESNVDLLSSESGRRSVLLEAVRIGAKRNFEFIIESPSWRTYTALCSTLDGLQSPHREQIHEALVKAEQHFLDRMSAFYDEMLPILRYRLRTGRNSRQIAALGAAVVEGMAERRVVMPGLVDAPVPGPGLKGSTVDWHLAALGFLGVIEVMIEPES